MDHHAPVEIDPASLQTAQKNWDGFVTAGKYMIISIVVLLLGMAVFLT